MHAVVVHLTITADFDTDTSQLREQVVPAVSHAPGFVAGYWTRKERSGLSSAPVLSGRRLDSDEGAPLSDAIRGV